MRWVWELPCGGFMSVLIEPQILNKTIFIKGMGDRRENLQADSFARDYHMDCEM